MATLMIAMMSVGSCKSNDNGDEKGKGNGNGNTTVTQKGQVEFNEKNYPLHESSAIVSGDEAPYSVTLSFENSGDGDTSVIVGIKSSSKTELANVENNEIAYSAFTVEGEGLDTSGSLSDRQVQITKSGNEYDITITATATTSGGKTLPFKLTYKGTVKIF